MINIYKNILIILLILTIIGIVWLGLKDNYITDSYQRELKTRIDSLSREIKYRDSLYIIKSLEKDKITIIREKVTIETESKRVAQLDKELGILKALVYRDTTVLTPQELVNYFNGILQ